MLAKDAATIDLLSGGRLEIGVGAGWLPPDYEKTGIPFESPANRFERLTETVRILKSFFGDDDSVTFRGKHYSLDRLDAFPKPAQRPRPPIMVGGRQKRLISFAAREADIVALLMYDRRLGHPNPPTFEDKVGWVREAAGDRFEDLEFHVYAADLVVTDDREGALTELTKRNGISREEALSVPGTLVGSVDSVCEQIQGWREFASLPLHDPCCQPVKPRGVSAGLAKGCRYLRTAAPGQSGLTAAAIRCGAGPQVGVMRDQARME